MTEDQVNQHMLWVIFQQYSFKDGVKTLGNEGENAVNKELQQHHDRKTFVPIDGTIKEGKNRCTWSTHVRNPKRDNTVKARNVQIWEDIVSQ